MATYKHELLSLFRYGKGKSSYTTKHDFIPQKILKSSHMTQFMYKSFQLSRLGAKSKYVPPQRHCLKLNFKQNKRYLLISFSSPREAKQPSGNTSTAVKSVSIFFILRPKYSHFF